MGMNLSFIATDDVGIEQIPADTDSSSDVHIVEQHDNQDEECSDEEMVQTFVEVCTTCTQFILYTLMCYRCLRLIFHPTLRA